MSYSQPSNPQYPGQAPVSHSGTIKAPPGMNYPGKTLGVVGLVLSFFTALIGFILSIVALIQSKNAGYKNTPAFIGVVIGIVSTVLVVTVLAQAQWTWTWQVR